MKILLTGANGQVGQAIQDASKRFAHELVACDRQMLDITNADQVKSIFDQLNPEAVINAAAYTAVDKAESEQELAFAVNAMGAKNLAQACEAAKIPLYHLSTDYIFDGKKTTPYVEDDPATPLGVYGESKWQGEQFIQQCCEKHFILRVSWVFGEHGHNFVKTMLRLMQEKESLNVVNDQHGCPTYAGDIALLLLTLCEVPHWGTFHYCGTPATTWYNFAKVVWEEAAKKMPLRIKAIHPIPTSEYPTPAKRPQNSVLSCDKLYTIYRVELRPWWEGLVTMLEQVS